MLCVLSDAADRKAWVSRLFNHKLTSGAEIETVRSSAEYHNILRSLEAGNAFNAVEAPDSASEVIPGARPADALAAPNRSRKFARLIAEYRRVLSLRALVNRLKHGESAYILLTEMFRILTMQHRSDDINGRCSGGG